MQFNPSKMAEHPELYGSPSRPYSMRASLIIPDDNRDDLDASTAPSDGISAAWHTVLKHWRHHRHSILVGVILVACFALVMCFFTTQGAVVAQSRPPQKAWRTVPHLMIVNTTEFQAFVGPLAEMTMNAHTWPRAQPIAGWQLAGDPLGFVGSVKGGMHALTYVVSRRRLIQLLSDQAFLSVSRSCSIEKLSRNWGALPERW